MPSRLDRIDSKYMARAMQSTSLCCRSGIRTRSRWPPQAASDAMSAAAATSFTVLTVIDGISRFLASAEG
jgi:hypothetical protein